MGIFLDQRLCISVLIVWMGIQIGVFVCVGGTKANGMIKFGYGPSADLKYVGIPIDTQESYDLFVFCNVLDVVLHVWCTEVLSPWITNVVYNRNQTKIAYSRFTTMLIVNFYSVYNDIRAILLFFLIFTQIDIVGIRILVDAIITSITSWSYIKEKSCPGEYFEPVDGSEDPENDNEVPPDTPNTVKRRHDAAERDVEATRTKIGVEFELAEIERMEENS